jgi:tetratricopeptide (TPR) repeat protein
MSLINDVLKDLEQRRSSDPSASQSVSNSSPQLRSPARNRQWIWWLSAAILTGVVLHGLTENRPLTPESLPMLAELTPIATKPVAIAGLKAEEAEAASFIEPVEPPPQPASSDSLRQDPAIAGVRPVIEALESPVNPGIDTPIAATPASTLTPASTPAPASTPPPPTNIDIRRAAQPASEQETVLDTAKRAISRGQLPRAEAMLIELVSQSAPDPDAFILLATLLVDQGRTREAVSSLHDGLDRISEPASIAALLGRILLERDQAERAIDVLTAHAPLPAVDPDYHLLLAAAFRQADDHLAAADRYRTLTGIVPERGAAWVGLATSLEALNRPREAVDAYREALSGQDQRLVQFARQRLRVLEHQHGDQP